MIPLPQEKNDLSEKEEILKKLEELEHKIDLLNKDKLVDAEDQLFFGVVISFFIFFITLPVNDFSTFLQNSFNATTENADYIAQTVTYFGIVLFLFSALTRYYAIVGNQHHSKKCRYLSIEGLMFTLNSTIVLVFVNATFAFPSLPRPIGIVVTVASLTLTMALMNILEKRVLSFYQSRDFITKKLVFPFSSSIFLSIFLAISCVNLGQIGGIVLGVSPQLLDELFAPLTLILSMVLWVAYFIGNKYLQNTGKTHNA
jgi:hypothetical protein